MMSLKHCILLTALLAPAVPQTCWGQGAGKPANPKGGKPAPKQAGEKQDKKEAGKAASGKEDASKTSALSALEPPTSKATIDDLLKQAQQARQQNKVPEAVAALREAVSLYPRDVRGYVGLAEVELEQKQYKEAEQAARSVTLLNETGPGGYLLLAEALTEESCYPEARDAVQRVIQMDPQLLAARMQLGQIALREKNYDVAEKAFRDALGLAPDSVDVHSSLGDVAEQQNRHEAAVHEYEAAMNALDALPGGKSPQAEALRRQLRMSRAASLAGMKRYAEAESEMRSLLALSPKEAPIHSTLAQVLDTAGKHAEAIEEYKAAIAISPNDAITWGNMGWAQYNAGRYEDAIQSSRKALTLDQTLIYVRFNLGLIYSVQNQWSLAQTEYKAALAGAVPADIEAGIGDVHDALSRKPGEASLTQALDLLTTAEDKKLGLLD